MASRVWLTAPLLLAASACTQNTLPAPRITAVEADSLRKIIGDDADREFRVVGENFSAGVIADAGDPGNSKPDEVVVTITHAGGDGLPILVTGTLQSPTEFLGTIPPEVDGLLERGLYDVTFANADGNDDTIAGAFELGYPAETMVFQAPLMTEASPGSANNISATISLRAADNGPGWVKAGFKPTLVLVQGTNAAITSTESFLALDDAPITFLVTDSSHETVIVTATSASLPAGITLVEDVTMNFLAGPPDHVSVVAGAEINIADDFADTVVQVEDQWGNPTNQNPLFKADVLVTFCSGATADPALVTINPGEASAPIRIYCATTTDTAVSLFENGTFTGYPTFGTVIVFN